MSVIEIKNLKKVFKAGVFYTRVLRGVDLEVQKGEFVIIFGPSGAGKSTLLNIILGLEKPTSGEVEIFHHSFYKLQDEDRASLRRKKFGVIYQQANWLKSLNVIENVSFPLLLAGASEKKAREAAGKRLELVNMYRFSNYKPLELSGGQQQKVSLARALVSDPEIIMADEPTGNLDTESGIEIMNVLKVLSKYEKKTIILVTHNPEYRKYASKLVFLEDGLIIKTDLQDMEIPEMEETLDLISPKKFIKNRRRP